MKKDTQEVKILLQKALLATSYDNALNEVRRHIKTAIIDLEHVESKRARRQENYERREISNKNKALNDPFKIIKAIDEEIGKTKASLDEMQKRRFNKSDIEKDDDDEFQTVFG